MMSENRGPMHDKVIEVRWETLNSLVSQVNWLLEDDVERSASVINGVDYELSFANAARDLLEDIAKVLNPVVDARPEGWHESEKK
jgi:hypothetical protein